MKDPFSKSGVMKIYQFSCETYLNIMGERKEDIHKWPQTG